MSEEINNCSHIDLEFIKPGKIIAITGDSWTWKTTFVQNTIKCLIDKRNNEKVDYSSLLKNLPISPCMYDYN